MGKGRAWPGSPWGSAPCLLVADVPTAIHGVSGGGEEHHEAEGRSPGCHTAQKGSWQPGPELPRVLQFRFPSELLLKDVGRALQAGAEALAAV